MNDLFILAQEAGTDPNEYAWLSFGFLILMVAVIVGALVLFVAALVSIVRSQNYHTGGKTLWILICFVFPFVCPLAWFLFGRNSTM